MGVTLTERYLERAHFSFREYNYFIKYKNNFSKRPKQINSFHANELNF